MRLIAEEIITAIKTATTQAANIAEDTVAAKAIGTATGMDTITEGNIK